MKIEKKNVCVLLQSYQQQKTLNNEWNDTLKVILESWTSPSRNKLALKGNILSLGPDSRIIEPPPTTKWNTLKTKM